MMLPYMTSNVKRERKSISKFGGLNRTVSRGDGELKECINTSGRNYPAMSSSEPRTEPVDTGVNINGADYKNSLYYTGTTVASPKVTKMYYGGKSVTVSTDSTASLASRKRSFASQGDSVLIIPDNKIYNTSDNSIYTVEYSKTVTQSSAYEAARSECNTSSLYNISDYVGEITSAGIVSSKFSTNGYTSYLMTFEEIKAGDIVHLSMDVSPREYDSIDDNYWDYKARMKEGVDLKITSVNKTEYKTSSGEVSRITSVEFGENVLDMGGFSIVVIMSITLSRQMPPLEHVCSLNNRVWGVYDNTIRCSKLGDCSHWYDFTADAYGTLPSSCFSTEVDSNGSFTAIVPYGGSIVAFKENCLHKIYGSDPDSYTLSTLDCKGVKEGCADTVAVLDGTVYYMGIDGVYAYRGGTPELVSKKPDLSAAEAICAGTDGINYYLSVREKGSAVMYIYYPDCKVWHREEISSDTSCMVSAGSKLYSAAGTYLACLRGESGDKAVSWSFAMEFDEDMYNTRSYGRLLINYSLSKDGEFVIKSVCDGDTSLTCISPESNHRENAYSVIPLPFIGCKDFRLEFEGRGDFTLKNITREYVITPEENNNLI